MTCACLERVVDDPVPALAGAAGLRVDVVLELACAACLETDAVHLVAVVLLQRVDVAEDLVVDEQVHHQPQARAVGPFDPLVVGLLVRVRPVVGPAPERGPADGVVGPDRDPVLEEVLGHRDPSVRLVVGAVDECVRSAEAVPRLAAVDSAAHELVGHVVEVSLDEAGDLGVGRRTTARRAAHVRLDLGVGGAAVALLEREEPAVAAVAPDERERAVAVGGERLVRRGETDAEDVRAGYADLPIGSVARRPRGFNRALEAGRGGEVVSGRTVEEVAAEIGRLHAERLRLADARSRGAIRVAGLRNEAARRLRL